MSNKNKGKQGKPNNVNDEIKAGFSDAEPQDESPQQSTPQVQEPQPQSVDKTDQLINALEKMSQPQNRAAQQEKEYHERKAKYLENVKKREEKEAKKAKMLAELEAEEN